VRRRPSRCWPVVTRWRARSPRPRAARSRSRTAAGGSWPVRPGPRRPDAGLVPATAPGLPTARVKHHVTKLRRRRSSVNPGAVPGVGSSRVRRLLLVQVLARRLIDRRYPFLCGLQLVRLGLCWGPDFAGLLIFNAVVLAHDKT